jgi:chromate transporter
MLPFIYFREHLSGPVFAESNFVAGLPGAIVAALGTFLPCYLFTIIPAPYFQKYGKRPGIVAFVDGVTAAAIGAISGAAIILSLRTISGWPPAIIAIITIFLLWKAERIPEPLIVLMAAIAGLAIKFHG